MEEDTVFQQTLSELVREPSKLFEPREYENDFTRTYDQYICSTKWARRKIAYYNKHQRACRACGATQGIHLHHHTYKRLGNEHDDDLVPLCEPHHVLVHRRHRELGGSLTTVTRHIVEFYGGTWELTPRKRRSAAHKSARRRDTRRGKRPPKKTPAPVRKPLPLFNVGDRVVVAQTDVKNLKWAVGKKGTIVCEMSAKTWHVELDEHPGSRLGVTAKMVVRL